MKLKSSKSIANDDDKSPRKVIVKIMTSSKDANEVFNFFINCKNMETGSAIKSVTEDDDGWWIFDHVVAGKSKMKRMPSRKFGILDEIFIGGGLEWQAYVRTIPNQAGSTTTWMFTRPDGLTDWQFEEQLKGFDKEIEGWKRALEGL